MSFTVKLWGVRGSLPAPLTPIQVEQKVEALLNAFYREHAVKPVDPNTFLAQIPRWQKSSFGGHTSCFEVRSSKAQLIIDGGSGLLRLGELMMREQGGLGAGEYHILMTHFHWDHIMGLPFFSPIFVRGNKIHFYAVQEDLEENIRLIFQKPRFPVPFNRLGADIFFHKLEPRQMVQFKDIQVTPYQLDHPDPCWGYRMECEGRVYAHCVDTECVRMSIEHLGNDRPLYQNVDAMLFDAQYSFSEASERVSWGHASAPWGLDLALREKVKKIYFVHHDPSASDEKINKMEEETREYLTTLLRNRGEKGSLTNQVEWVFAYEGMIINV